MADRSKSRPSSTPAFAALSSAGVAFSARRHRTVLVSAGRRGLEAELAPADLVSLTDAVVASIGR